MKKPQPTKTKIPPRVQRQEKNRARILSAARALFNKGGVAGLSIRAIATHAGMPAMTLYSYFPNKTAIVRALWSQAFAPMFKELDAVEAREKNPKERLRKVAQGLVDYWLRYPDRYRLVFLIEDKRDEADSWYIEETDVVPAYLRFAPLIAAARGDPGGDYRREGEALICSLTGIVHMLVTVSEYSWAKSDTYVDVVVRGLLSTR
jgi:AcrR family transcriptional regulator